MMTTMKTDKNFILAVDIGGTKVAVGLIDLTGKILASDQLPTCQTGPEDGIRQIIDLLEKLLANTGTELDQVKAIGIGIPAVLEPETDFVIWGPNLNGWRNVDLRSGLASHFGIPVCVEYDGHTAVLGEWWVGAGRSYRSMVDIIIGTGLGGGMVLDGRLFRGRNRLAGAAGWFGLTLDADRQTENARSIGYWESRIAGPAVAERAKKVARLNPGSALDALNIEGRVSAETVFALASQGDPIAKQFCDQLAGEIGVGIANVVSLVDPEVVILGGGMGSNCGVLLPRIREVVNCWAQPISAKAVDIVLSKLGPQAGLLGAAYGALLRVDDSTH
jgi:glucokinase